MPEQKQTPRNNDLGGTNGDLPRRTVLTAAAFAVPAIAVSVAAPAAAASANATITLAAPTAAQAGDDVNASVVATVLSQNGTPLPGEPVVFTVAPTTVGSFPGGASTYSASTNASGRAQLAGLTLNGAGALSITASNSGHTARASVTVTAAPAPIVRFDAESFNVPTIGGTVSVTGTVTGSITSVALSYTGGYTGGPSATVSNGAFSIDVTGPAVPVQGSVSAAAPGAQTATAGLLTSSSETSGQGVVWAPDLITTTVGSTVTVRGYIERIPDPGTAFPSTVNLQRSTLNPPPSDWTVPTTAAVASDGSLSFQVRAGSAGYADLNGLFSGANWALSLGIRAS